MRAVAAQLSPRAGASLDTAQLHLRPAPSNATLGWVCNRTHQRAGLSAAKAAEQGLDVGRHGADPHHGGNQLPVQHSLPVQVLTTLDEELKPAVLDKGLGIPRLEPNLNCGHGRAGRAKFPQFPIRPVVDSHVLPGPPVLKPGEKSGTHGIHPAAKLGSTRCWTEERNSWEAMHQMAGNLARIAILHWAIETNGGLG